MARRKQKQVKHAPMAPEIEARFRKLMVPSPARPLLFCGFRLRRENVNRLWRWDTLEDVKNGVS